MAKATHRLCLPVGKWQKQDGSEQIEYREIGVLMEFEGKTGGTWQEIKLHADALNPVLAGLAKQMMDKGTANARVKLFEIERKPRAPEKTQWPDEEPVGGAAADNDIPF